MTGRRISHIRFSIKIPRHPLLRLFTTPSLCYTELNRLTRRNSNKAQGEDHMKKNCTLALLLVLAMVIACLAGCGSNTAASASAPAEHPASAPAESKAPAAPEAASQA